MEATNKTRQILNESYYLLETKRAELIHALHHRMFELTSGFYNGHYRETSEGDWQMDYYPIPVVTVQGLCDIEIDFDRVSVSTKLKRDAALCYSYETLDGCTFEAFGVEDYLSTYYRKGLTFEDMRESIAQSKEEEIGFAFFFPFEVEGQKILEFVKLLRREGFYY